MTGNRLAGHTLKHEGKVYGYNRPVKHGRALCSCGADSPALDSDAARKRWHREHKANVRAAMDQGWPSLITLGDIADRMRLLKDVGITRNAMLYVVDRVWWEDTP